MSEIFNLSGKRAVVTGGGSGIGKAICYQIAQAGGEVIVLDFDEKLGEETVVKIKSVGGMADFIRCDVSDYDSVHVSFQKVGTLNILINNAGIAHIGNVANTTERDFDKVYQVNVKGVFNCLKEGVSRMKSTGGSIINISSIAAHSGINDRFAYSMSKGAVHAMTLSVAKDFIDHNIRCNSISPGRIHTPFVDGFLTDNYPGQEKEMFEKLAKTQPIGRMGKPEEVGALVLYLCSEEAAFITGSDFSIDGGFLTLNN